MRLSDEKVPRLSQISIYYLLYREQLPITC